MLFNSLNYELGKATIVSFHVTVMSLDSINEGSMVCENGSKPFTIFPSCYRPTSQTFSLVKSGQMIDFSFPRT